MMGCFLNPSVNCCLMLEREYREGTERSVSFPVTVASDEQPRRGSVNPPRLLTFSLMTD